MTLDEILMIEDIGTRIEYLKKGRKTEVPDANALYKDWNPNLHEIVTDKEKYPDITITKKQESTVFDEATGKVRTIPAETETVAPNRIALPIEQDIVNIQTAFAVGTEPTLDCETEDEDEKGLLKALRYVMRKCKLKYQNRKIVRSYLSEQECAEYWYAVKDDSFWARLIRTISSAFGNVRPEYRLRSVLWSPFRGDTLYPFFDETGDLVAFSREYKRRELDGTETPCFMTVTSRMVYNFEGGDDWSVKSFIHGFSKIPVLYCHRDSAYCANIKTMRVRLEKLLSGYADCIDYHFFPILKLFGTVTNFVSGGMRSRTVQLTGEGADAAYVTWQQSSETVKLEADTLTNNIYNMSNTPRISPTDLKGIGSSVSGVSFRYIFMGAHMQVENHAEELGPFFQRRVNFLISALGSLNTNFQDASKTIDVETDLQPYMIDSIADKVNTAVAAVGGPVWSRREGIMFAGNAERVAEELEEIENDEKAPVAEA